MPGGGMSRFRFDSRIISSGKSTSFNGNLAHAQQISQLFARAVARVGYFLLPGNFLASGSFAKNSFSNYIKIPLIFLYNKISFVLVLRTFYVRGSFSKIQDGEFVVSPISTSEKVTACFCEK
jgi:hypothetical protein